MKLALTGAGGYLGTVLTRRLLAAGHTLILCDDGRYGLQGLLSATTGATPGLDYEIRLGDVCEPDLLGSFKGVDAVVHLAAIVGYPACDRDPQEAHRVNVEGTRVVCEHAGDTPVILASTGSTYGEVPSGRADEDLPVSPLTVYGRTKAEAEAITLDHGGCVLRFATLFGPSDRMRWDQLPHDFVKQAVRGDVLRVYEPDAWRPFLHVRDAANAIGWLVRGGVPREQVLNVGRDSLQVTKGQLADLVVDHAVDPQASWEAVDGADVERRTYQVDYHRVARAIPDWARGAPAGLDLATGIRVVSGWAQLWLAAGARFTPREVPDGDGVV